MYRNICNIHGSNVAFHGSNVAFHGSNVAFQCRILFFFYHGKTTTFLTHQSFQLCKMDIPCVRWDPFVPWCSMCSKGRSICMYSGKSKRWSPFWSKSWFHGPRKNPEYLILLRGLLGFGRIQFLMDSSTAKQASLYLELPHSFCLFGRFFGWISAQNFTHKRKIQVLPTQHNALLKGKSFKFTIHLQCFIPRKKWVIYIMIPEKYK